MVPVGSIPGEEGTLATNRTNGTLGTVPLIFEMEHETIPWSVPWPVPWPVPWYVP